LIKEELSVLLKLKQLISPSRQFYPSSEFGFRKQL